MPVSLLPGLSKLFQLSEPHFFICKMKTIWSGMRINICKVLRECLAYRKHDLNYLGKITVITRQTK